ncbi:hypothetical protein D3C76_1698510 [compost metagenome]
MSIVNRNMGRPMATPVEWVSTPSIKAKVTYTKEYMQPYSRARSISATPVSPPPVLNQIIPLRKIAAAATAVRLRT